VDITIKAPMRRVTYYHIRAKALQNVAEANRASFIDNLVSG